MLLNNLTVGTPTMWFLIRKPLAKLPVMTMSQDHALSLRVRRPDNDFIRSVAVFGVLNVVWETESGAGKLLQVPMGG